VREGARAHLDRVCAAGGAYSFALAAPQGVGSEMGFDWDVRVCSPRWTRRRRRRSRRRCG
jgi:hypothetical protein